MKLQEDSVISHVCLSGHSGGFHVTVTQNALDFTIQDPWSRILYITLPLADDIWWQRLDNCSN